MKVGKQKTTKRQTDYIKTHFTFTVEMLECSALIIKSRGIIAFKNQCSAHFRHPAPEDRITCEVLCFEMQVIEFVNVPYIHLFLIQFSLIEVL